MATAIVNFLWPFPARITAEEQKQYADEDRKALQRIADLRGFPSQELDSYLQAAQRILDYEDRRKAGAESRASAYIAAIATLIPLMTWALGNTTPFCAGIISCGAWSAGFDVAVFYFIFAAFWCLRTLAVANYHAFGVEELVEIRERQRPLGKELVVQTMLLARANRDTINRKLDFIKTAQRCFFVGLMILAALLALDPWFRLGTQATYSAPSIGGTLPDSDPKQPMAASSAASKATASETSSPSATPATPAASAAASRASVSAVPVKRDPATTK